MFLWQWPSDSSFFELASTPKKPPTPTAMTPVLATTIAVTLCPRPRDAVLSSAEDEGAAPDGCDGARGATGATSSRGIATVSEACAASRVTVVDHGLLPGAVASILCGPGSTGAAVPKVAAPMGSPSRRT